MPRMAAHERSCRAFTFANQGVPPMKHPPAYGMLWCVAIFSSLILGVAAAGCQADQLDPAVKGGKKSMSIKITSSAFKDGEQIPKKYTGEGDDVSPPLSWSDLPEGTKELVLICDDPDAPNETWVHWVIYKLPADLTGLPEGIPRQPRLKNPPGALQGQNSWPKDRTSAIAGRCRRPVTASIIITSSSTPWRPNWSSSRAWTRAPSSGRSKTTCWARAIWSAPTSGRRIRMKDQGSRMTGPV